MCANYFWCEGIYIISPDTGLFHPPSSLLKWEVMSQTRTKQVLSQKTRVHQVKQFKVTFRHKVLESDGETALER